jgi:8-oxo-dGTP pyrophosphatase MutT (NUDIX family)
MRGSEGTGATMADTMAEARLRAALQAHARAAPGAQATLAAEFAALLDDPADPFVRDRLAGHFTASAWLVDRSGARLLMTHHRKLGLWLQLGGHADGDRDLARVALREAEEESGLAGLSVDPAIFDVDRHFIPEHKGVPGHWHYDVRYVVRTGDSEAFTVSDESHALAWRPIAEVARDAAYDASLRRMARKWLQSEPGSE